MSRILDAARPQTPAAPAARPVLDEYEQGLAIEASMEAFHEVETCIQEIDHAADIHASLESLAFVAEKIESASVVELALVDVACEMAVAGSDLTPEMLTPGLESAEGQVISTEGLREMAKSIWEAIKSFMAKIAKQAARFFDKLLLGSGLLRKQLISLKEKAGEKEGKSPENKEFEAASYLNRLAIEGKLPTKSEEVIKALECVSEAAEFIFGDYTKVVNDNGADIITHLKSFEVTGESTEAQVSGLLDAMTKSLTAVPVKGLKFNQLGNKKDQRFAPDADVRYFHLPSNFTLYAELYKESKKTKGDEGGFVLSNARRMRRRALNVMETDVSQKPVKEAKIGTLSPSEVIAVVDAALVAVDTLESWGNNKLAKELGTKNKDIISAGNDLEKKVGKAKTDGVVPSVLAYPKSAQEFGQGFARWAVEPHTKIAKLALTTVRAVMPICSKSLAEYK